MDQGEAGCFRQVAALHSDHYGQVPLVGAGCFRQVAALHSDHYRQVPLVGTGCYRQVAALYSDHYRQVTGLIRQVNCIIQYNTIQYYAI